METFIMILPGNKNIVKGDLQQESSEANNRLKKWSLESDLKKHVTQSVIVARKNILSNTVCKLNPELATAGFAAWVTACGVAKV